MTSSDSVEDEGELSSVEDVAGEDDWCPGRHISPSPSVSEEQGMEDSGGCCTLSALID